MFFSFSSFSRLQISCSFTLLKIWRDIKSFFCKTCELFILLKVLQYLSLDIQSWMLTILCIQQAAAGTFPLMKTGLNYCISCYFTVYCKPHREILVFVLLLHQWCHVITCPQKIIFSHPWPILSVQTWQSTHKYHWKQPEWLTRWFIMSSRVVQ